tara:strand:- start:6 stop:188 length:183 start_codon:yes stop_codon:yes gene_type:complete
MAKVFFLALLGIALSPAALSHHKYLQAQQDAITENGHLTTTQEPESKYGSHGKNVPHVHQ